MTTFFLKTLLGNGAETNLADLNSHAVNLPVEVWLDILEANWMAPKELSAMRLVCKSFGNLVKPHLFRTFTIRPILSRRSLYSAREIPQTPALMIKDALAAIRKRLEFLSSPEIAPLIKLIRVYPQSYHKSLEIEADCNSILDYFFEHLPRFIHLQTLYCEDIPFNDYALRQLCQMEYLGELKLRECCITATDIPCSNLKLTTMEFHSSDVAPSAPVQSYVQWLTLPQTAQIRRLRLSIANAKLAQGFLHGLSICPLPLTQLTMPHDPAALVRTLRDLPAMAREHLTTLSIQTAYITENMFMVLSSCFLHVKDLTIMVHLQPTSYHSDIRVPAEAYTAQDFLTALLVLKLPSSIRRLCISFLQVSGLPQIDTTVTRERYSLLKERLFCQYPTLEWVQFDASGHHASWTRADKGNSYVVPL